MRRSGASIDSIMHKEGWKSPSTFIKHYSFPIKHFQTMPASVSSQSVFPTAQPQPVDTPQPQPAQWEDDPDPVDDVLVSHAMPQVNKIIHQEINFKCPGKNTATFCKLQKSERKVITILEKDLRSTVKAAQRIMESQQNNTQTDVIKPVEHQDQLVESPVSLE